MRQPGVFPGLAVPSGSAAHTVMSRTLILLTRALSQNMNPLRRQALGLRRDRRHLCSRREFGAHDVVGVAALVSGGVGS